MTADESVAGFEPLYGEAEKTDGLIPWDIGGPQPVVEQLVAYGAIRGEVLDPGTGPGYHAIHYASQGYSATGVDGSPTAIARAKRNAERAGVQVDFQVADATKLDGFEGRFDTVVDSAFYHVLMDDEAVQTRYAQALHRATKPGARLFMFEFSPHNVNGIQWVGIPADNFERVLGAGGWRIGLPRAQHLSGPLRTRDVRRHDGDCRCPSTARPWRRCSRYNASWRCSTHCWRTTGCTFRCGRWWRPAWLARHACTLGPRLRCAVVNDQHSVATGEGRGHGQPWVAQRNCAKGCRSGSSA